MRTLRITLFSDGRPGHEKQSRGVVEALRNYIDAEVSERRVERLGPGRHGISHLRYLLSLDTCPDLGEGIDLVIGTGSQTHIPVLSAARRYGAKAVVCMSPPIHLINRFDLCCVPIHDELGDGDNIFRTVGPPNTAVPSSRHDRDRALILIGGRDETSHEWSSVRLVEDIAKLLAEDKRWTISTSPRTPEDTEMLIRDQIRDREDISFQPYSLTPPGWVEEQYRINETVWITADSVSMVYEALSAGCRVGILPVRWKKSDNKFKRGLDYLGNRRLIVRFEAYQPGAPWVSDHEPLNESDRCAREILRRWWPTHTA